jgi:hypothetical protein
MAVNVGAKDVKKEDAGALSKADIIKKGRKEFYPKAAGMKYISNLV